MAIAIYTYILIFLTTHNNPFKSGLPTSRPTHKFPTPKGKTNSPRYRKPP